MSSSVIVSLNIKDSNIIINDKSIEINVSRDFKLNPPLFKVINMKSLRYFPPRNGISILILKICYLNSNEVTVCLCRVIKALNLHIMPYIFFLCNQNTHVQVQRQCLGALLLLNLFLNLFKFNDRHHHEHLITLYTISSWWSLNLSDCYYQLTDWFTHSPMLLLLMQLKKKFKFMWDFKIDKWREFVVVSEVIS